MSVMTFPIDRAEAMPAVPSDATCRATAETAETAPCLRAVGLRKSYWLGSHPVPVLSDVSLEVKSGEFLAIVGQSGSGKSTLLHLLGTLDQPDAGEVWFAGRRIDNLSTRRRDAFRNRQLGMIFQFYHLIPELTMLENVLSPAMIADGLLRYYVRRGRHVLAAKQLIAHVGLSHRMKHKPRQLSGGEMQRAAIARALINQPQILLADEPTGNLDTETGREILALLRSLNREWQLTMVMVTHDPAIAAQADRTLRLVDGRLVDR